MNKSRISLMISLCLLFVLMIGVGGTTHAQSQSLYWDRLDVNITVLQNGDIQIMETQEIVFTAGSFHFGYRNIPTSRLDSISNIEVWEGGKAYAQQSGTSPYTFHTFRSGNDLVVRWYFPYTKDSRHTYVLRYTVHGGLRYYDGGDQVFWKAVFADRDFPVLSSTVTVNLPAGIASDQLKVASYGTDARNEVANDGRVTFFARNIVAGDELEVRVQFPHGVVQGSPAAWQKEADFQDKWRPVLNLAVGGGSFLVLVLGLLLIYILWYAKGRDKPVGLVADYLAEPPATFRPESSGRWWTNAPTW